MIARTIIAVVLSIAACLAFLERRSAPQASVEDENALASGEAKHGAQLVHRPLDDDSIRVRLLMVEMVQADMGLTAEQVEKLNDLAIISDVRSRAFRSQLRESLPPSHHFPQDEFEAREREFRTLVQNFKTELKGLRTGILTILTPRQSDRLKQIQLQATMPTSLSRPEIVKALDISEEQQAKIRVLLEDMVRKQSAEWPDPRALNPKECQQKLIEIAEHSNDVQATTTDHVLHVLSAEQRTELEKLQGTKIDVTCLRDALIPADAESESGPTEEELPVSSFSDP